MKTIEATCPKCHATGPYGSELIGRYTVCQNCSCRFYVEVPTLAQSIAGSVVGPRLTTSPAETTLNDLLWDTQQGDRLLMHAMRQQQSELVRQKQLLIALCVLGLLNLIANLIPLLS